MSKILVFSDTHLTTKFSQPKFEKLKNLIEKADKVIINGDFWEGLQITFDEFYNSPWKQLFPLLKAKNSVYIYGNHDSLFLSDERIYEFCDIAAKEYKIELPKGKFFFTHGSEFLFPQCKVLYTPHEVNFERKWNSIIGTWIQTVLFAIFGPNIFPEKFNKMTKEERGAVAPLDYLLVCGHSHKPQYKEDLNFIDIGFFNFGWANYMTISDEGDYEFFSEKY